MPLLFLVSMFYLSFAPLWICIVCIDVKSLVGGTNCPYTEWISLGLILVTSVISIIIVVKTLKMQMNLGEYSVVTAEKDTISTTTYLLANALPLLAFDFTQYFDVILFIIIFGFLLIFCLLHHRCDSNVCLELAGYRLYKCKLRNESGGEKSTVVLIRRRQLNANDKLTIRKVNDELYIGRYKDSVNQ